MSSKTALLIGALAALACPAAASAAGIDVVAAENFYGDLAQQVGGRYVNVTSILSNPDQDPHLFEADPSTARKLKAAKLVIQQRRRLRPLDGEAARGRPVARPRRDRGRRPRGQEGGRQPAPVVRPRHHGGRGQGFAAKLGAIDPAHKAEFDRNAAAFEASLKPSTPRSPP